jgi:predicted amidohydrolase YtcJ
MPTARILKAARILTMDEANPVATAVAVGADGRIAAVGDPDTCTAALPGAEVVDLGTDILLPGFVESHSHPVLSGVTTQAPAYWIAPYVGYPHWSDVTALFEKVNKELPEGQAALFNGFDRLLHGAEAPTNTVLDQYFPDRIVAVVDNSGHGIYFSSATIKHLGWDKEMPPDPVGARFGRNPDGTSNGQAYEMAALMAVAAPLMGLVVTHPLASAAQWYALMAGNGITSTSEMTYDANQKVAFEALAGLPDSPLRISLYHVSTADDCAEPFTSSVPDEMLTKQGIKLWADGSPWVGNIAITFPYLDTPVTQAAGIKPGAHGLDQMNYTKDELVAVIDHNVASGLQFAFHVNGDAALDVVLDAYEDCLTRHKLLGTDHRWRIEHLGAARADQFERAAKLGVYASMGAFQMQYWGDLLDGQMFDPKYGAPWCRVKDATDAGLRPSYHNDGSVSPPNPLGNIKTCVTRTSQSGNVHAPEQAVTIDEALRAQTIDAAFILKREHLVGSIEVGKLADFVQLDVDPHEVDPMQIDSGISVIATWLNGERIDLKAFETAAGVEDPTPHMHLAASPRRCC